MVLEGFAIFNGDFKQFEHFMKETCANPGLSTKIIKVTAKDDKLNFKCILGLMNCDVDKDRVENAYQFLATMPSILNGLKGVMEKRFLQHLVAHLLGIVITNGFVTQSVCDVTTRHIFATSSYPVKLSQKEHHFSFFTETQETIAKTKYNGNKNFKKILILTAIVFDVSIEPKLLKIRYPVQNTTAQLIY